MTDTDKLKPCPFCGGKAYWQLKKVTYCQLHGEPSQDVGVYCKTCKIEIISHDKEMAIKLWNRRTHE